jgi:hypothetical protein
MTPQDKAILNHLQTGATISGLEALNRFGCFRLGARIHELKKAGYPIESKKVKSENGKHYSQYSLINQ